jgi:indole-3-glycerol phosphate synthase
MPSYLADILASHRAQARDDRRDTDELAEQVEEAARIGSLPAPRDFAGALRGPGLSCIAEVKRRSPSKGDLDPDLQPDLVAKEYEAGGAACLSVLTDERFFGGSVLDLQTAREASGLPVLRKDFTVAEVDVIDARRMGADAVLLIAAALSDDELTRFGARAATLGLAALVEVHDEEGPRCRSPPGRGEPARSPHLHGGPRPRRRAGRTDSRWCGGGGRVGHPGR